MVSARCKTAVATELRKLGFFHAIVDLGQVEIDEPISFLQNESLKMALLKSGLELIDDKKSVLTEKIKVLVVEMVHGLKEQLQINFSNYLSERLNYDYTYLANLFSEQQGITIEKFVILQKIERVKELLLYNELNLTEIAYQMHYSSVAHLSNQFKKVTGLTPSKFRTSSHILRITLENV